MSKVSDLVFEFERDRNCRADLWIDKENVTPNERTEFLMTVLVNSWQRTFSTRTEQSNNQRLRELLTWDKPRGGNDLEHTAKVTALQNILGE